MGPFFALERFLGAFGASDCVCWRSWPVFVRLGVLRVRFWRSPGRSREGLEAPRPYFSRFLRACACSGASVAWMLRSQQNTGRSGTKRTSEHVGPPARVLLIAAVTTLSHFQRFSLFPSGAAVCAQHIRRLPKGEPRVPDILPSSCQVLFAPTFKLQNASSKLWAQDSFLKCLPPILCSFPRTRTDRRDSSAICS